MKLLTYGIHDQFSISSGKKESLSIIEHNGQTLAIDCPAHSIRSLHEDTKLISSSVQSKIDHLFVSHTDSDHIGGIPQLLWFKKFGERQKLNLIAHPQVYDDIWSSLKVNGFKQDRTSQSPSSMSPDEYINYSPLSYGEEVIIPGFGKIRSFYRSTNHCVGMDVMAIQVFDEQNNNIANFSADTGYDSELIEFLYEHTGTVIHEVGAYTPGSFSHTDISELIQGVPEKNHDRTFINHIPEMREQEILSHIKDIQSSIRFADYFTRTVQDDVLNIISHKEMKNH